MTRKRQGTSLYFVVFVALMLLLGLTVEAARHDLGAWNFVASVSIAAAKAMLIVLFFMHVRDSQPLTKLVVCAGFLWLAILFTFSLADYWTRHTVPVGPAAASTTSVVANPSNTGIPW